MAKPIVLNDPMFELLRIGDIKKFNDQRDVGTEYNLRGTDLSRIDLRGLNADNLNLSDAYFRQTDLRGIDFRKANLEGASFAAANISGCYFPPELSFDEIGFSLEHGTRVRYKKAA